MFALLKVVFSVVVLCAAESDTDDAQTHAMLQVNSRGEAVKYDVRAESEQEADESEGEEDDGLQVAREAGAKYVLSDAHREAGKKLWKSALGPLFTKYVLALNDLTEYWARTIQRVGQNMDNITDAEVEKPREAIMEAIMHNWTVELRHLPHAFQNCSGDVFEMEHCMGLTRCIIEQQVGDDEGSIPSYLFAALVELEVVVKTIVMRDFIDYFHTSKGAHAHPCEDVLFQPTPAPAPAPAPISGALLSQELSEHATSAVATVAKVQAASDRMAQLLTPSNTSGLALLQPADLESVWHEPCAALGCNTGSWVDIMDSLHGHAEELVKVKAPAHAIRSHITAMRAAQRAVKQAARTSSSFLANFDTHLSRGVLKKARATKAYDSRFKEAGGVVDGAVAAWGWGGWRRLNWCWGVSLDKVIGYIKKVPPGSTWGVLVSMTFKNWQQLTVESLKKLLEGGKTCIGATIKLQFALLIGYVPGEPEAAGFAAGVSCAAQFKYNNCNNNLNLDLSLSASGAIYSVSTGCPFGVSLGGFPCTSGWSVGVNTICCRVNLLTGANNCR